MGMRPRYDESGKIIGAHNMIFDDISDQYKMQRVLIDKDIQEISYTTFMKQLRNAKVAEEFEYNNYYSREVISHLAIDYLYSALYVQKGIAEKRGKNVEYKKYVHYLEI